MKVLHIIPSVASVRGGPSQAVVEAVKALINAGVDAEIATTNDNGDDLLYVPIGKLVEYKQVPVQFFRRFSPKVNSIREFAFSQDLTTWLWQNVSQYDLLHVHAIFSYPSTIAMTIARLQRVPYIVRPLGQLCEWSLQQSYQKKQLYLKLIERANLNYSKCIHFTSEQEQQEAAPLKLRSPSFVVPHGLYIPHIIPNARQRLRQQLNLPDDEPIILFLSRLHAKKGLDYLIPALSKLLDYHFTFVIAGSGDADYESKIKSLVIAHGLQNRTHFTGFVKGEKKDLLLQGSDLFALTSHSENFGVAVLEALAAGIPAIITPGVALANMVTQENLGYVAEFDITAIATSIKQALDAPQEAKQRGDRARKFISENYTWDCIASKLISVYTEIKKIPTFTALN
ncbi:glycosyltransferase [Nostoc sp. CMAA1605]|uniref:glycosyltransferase n=1 Tax=Nostoc sp. CMAA1605 TaxID=2055159 RepID=UPI001F18E201|nr:glycosyltransferase [Nostoc sp. CMAA1605]MCF4967973.1 glycosyl transferase family 1 [Nostoc sp. CMAA1605]